jgi:hypothetical protein
MEPAFYNEDEFTAGRYGEPNYGPTQQPQNCMHPVLVIS